MRSPPSCLTAARPLALLAAFLVLSFNLLVGSRFLSPAPPPPRYTPDESYRFLSSGQPPNSPDFGLNLICWSASLSPSEDAPGFGEAYRSWRAQALPLLEGTGAYIYPYEALHITVATPAPSLHPGLHSWGAAERSLYTHSWLAALRGHPCAAPAGAAAAAGRPPPLPLLTPALRLSPTSGTAVLAWGDPTGHVAALRSCIAALAASLPPAAQSLLTPASFKAPRAGFVHTTVMRLIAPRAPGLTEAELEARWAQAVGLWDSLVTQQVEVVLAARSLVLVEGTELVNLAGPQPSDHALWSVDFGSAQ